MDCETQVESLLAIIFENYKSLDENSPTGLSDLLVPLPETAAPALAPAVQVYTIIHDILAPDAQMVLRNYIKVIDNILHFFFLSILANSGCQSFF